MVSAQLSRHRQIAIALCLLLGSGSLAAHAQFEFPKGLESFGNRNSKSEVTVEAQIKPAEGDLPALLFITASIADGFHISAVDQAEGGPLPTTITLSPNSQGIVAGVWQSLEPPKTHIDQEIWVGLELREHYKQVTWVAPLLSSEGAVPANLVLEGQVEGQACAQLCVPFEVNFTAKQGAGVALPAGFSFLSREKTKLLSKKEIALTKLAYTADGGGESSQPNGSNSRQSNDILISSKQTVIEVPAVDSTSTSPSTNSPYDGTTAEKAPNLTVAGEPYDLLQVSLEEPEEKSLAYFLLLAFLGGIILNVMPCVLPVIGLKVMSFVQQAGQSRAHAWALNCWYSAGIVAVFLILATLAVSLQLGWGGQFGSAGFSISLIAIVFAMALSLLGLWDIPIPGFVGSNTNIEITEREGPTAAFLKGVLTTLLATPCIGPFMVPALAWAVKQPMWMTYSVFAVLGIGMASPYLLIGAFPQLISFLPKPGAWMETFKKIMGLIMLGTVVWLLTFIEPPLVVPTVALLVVIVGACWWITQTPVTALFSEKLKSWVIAGLVVAIGAMGSYGWLYKQVLLKRYEKRLAVYAEQKIGEQRVQIARNLGGIQDNGMLRQMIADLAVQSSNDQSWQRFTLEKLGHLAVGEGRTVIVDFTADWCPTCHVLEKVVLKTQTIEEAITKADIITMEADYTKRPEVLYQTIKALGGIGVPLVAVFPGSDPYHPIVFSEGKYTKADLLQAIAKATGQEEVLETAANADEGSVAH